MARPGPIVIVQYGKKPTDIDPFGDEISENEGMTYGKVIIPIGPSIAYVQLSNGEYSLIDRESAARVKMFVWSVGSGGYALRNSNRKTTLLHAYLLGERPLGMYCDHKNRRRLDNRLCNLRWVTPFDNAANIAPERKAKSGYLGVQAHRNKFAARFGTGAGRYLGLFDTAEEAAAAVQRARADKFNEAWRRANCA